jgi:outer membrane murein-binding lipoprotein Lpp
VRSVRTLTIVAVGALVAAIVLLAACDRSVRVDYSAEAVTMTASETDRLAEAADLGSVEGVDVAEAPDVRTDTLV